MEKRKRKTKSLLAVILAGVILLASFVGCSKPSDVMVQEQASGASGAEVQTTPDHPAGSNAEESQPDGANLPASDGNYVYDYQVSMAPIPREIADLGGPCQGTV
ncbi:MAG: hypothetical protein NC399_09160, partial [Muribaculum sp.]|nr:hypothetical protein [Muribaculum sp.]